jgi:hypothetical protein
MSAEIRSLLMFSVETTARRFADTALLLDLEAARRIRDHSS